MFNAAHVGRGKSLSFVSSLNDEEVDLFFGWAGTLSSHFAVWILLSNIADVGDWCLHFHFVGCNDWLHIPSGEGTQAVTSISTAAGMSKLSPLAEPFTFAKKVELANHLFKRTPAGAA
jgi:hypothetical protein